MIENSKRRQLYDLLAAHENGIYTDGEVASACMELLYDQQERRQLWNDLPRWVANAIAQQLRAFSDADEVVTFGRGNPQDTKTKLLELKAWLVQEAVSGRDLDG